MTVLVDINCPSCDSTGAVRKLGIGSYRCEDCGCEFSQADILPS